jgi:hypothetical protein
MRSDDALDHQSRTPTLRLGNWDVERYAPLSSPKVGAGPMSHPVGGHDRRTPPPRYIIDRANLYGELSIAAVAQLPFDVTGEPSGLLSLQVDHSCRRTHPTHWTHPTLRYKSVANPEPNKSAANLETAVTWTYAARSEGFEPPTF